MKNERKTVPPKRIPRLSRELSDSIRAHVDEELIFERTKKIMEQVPFSSAPRNRWEQPVGERHTSGFETWLQEDLKHYTGRPR